MALVNLTPLEEEIIKAFRAFRGGDGTSSNGRVAVGTREYKIRFRREGRPTFAEITLRKGPED